MSGPLLVLGDVATKIYLCLSVYMHVFMFMMVVESKHVLLSENRANAINSRSCINCTILLLKLLLDFFLFARI